MDLILVHSVQLKPTIKVQISGRMACISISDVVTTSVYSEKTHLKKLMMMKMIIIIIISTCNMNKLQETTVFHGRQKLTSAMKQSSLLHNNPFISTFHPDCLVHLFFPFFLKRLNHK